MTKAQRDARNRLMQDEFWATIVLTGENFAERMGAKLVICPRKSKDVLLRHASLRGDHAEQQADRKPSPNQEQ
jgi:hypothetical protein